MSDTSQGPGWWQASDGKWYPPEQAPGATPGTPPSDPSAYGAPPAYGTPPAYGAPAGGPPQGASATDAFGYGWAKFQQHVGPLLIAMVVYLVGAAIIGGISYTILGKAGFIGSVLFQIIYWVIIALIQMAIIRGSLFIVDGRPLELKDMFATDQLGQYILAAVLVAIATGIGIILCVIPGLIVAFFAAYYGYFVLDKKMEAVDAIKASFSFVQANVGTLIVFYLLSLVAYFVGAALCGIGLLVAIPVVIIGQAFLYRRLTGGAVSA